MHNSAQGITTFIYSTHNLRPSASVRSKCTNIFERIHPTYTVWIMASTLTLASIGKK
jgi:hypothetical protein